MTLAPWLEPLFSDLVLALASGRLPHGLLIHGPGGWGETDLADALALEMIERDHAGASAVAVAHPDLRWIVAEGAGEQITIDSVRTVADFIHQTPQIAQRKVVVFAAAEAMNLHAANALLKTLEEPPPDSYLILVTDALGELLPTLRSRCQLVAIRPGDPATTLAWVREQVPTAKAEHIEALSFEYGGAPYRLLEALERDERPIAGPLCDVATGRHEPLQLAEAWGNSGAIELLERWMRYVPRLLAGGLLAAGHGSEPLSSAFERTPRQRLLEFWQQLAAARGLLRGTTNPNQRLLLETLLLKWRDLAKPA